MRRKNDIIRLGVPRLAEMLRRPPINERGITAAIPAMMQKPFRMGEVGRFERAKAVPRAHRLQTFAQNLDGAIQLNRALLQLATGMHPLHRRLNGMGDRLQLMLIGFRERLAIKAVQHL